MLLRRTKISSYSAPLNPGKLCLTGAHVTSISFVTHLYVEATSKCTRSLLVKASVSSRKSERHSQSQNGSKPPKRGAEKANTAETRQVRLQWAAFEHLPSQSGKRSSALEKKHGSKTAPTNHTDCGHTEKNERHPRAVIPQVHLTATLPFSQLACRPRDPCQLPDENVRRASPFCEDSSRVFVARGCFQQKSIGATNDSSCKPYVHGEHGHENKNQDAAP